MNKFLTQFKQLDIVTSGSYKFQFVGTFWNLTGLQLNNPNLKVFNITKN